MSPSGCLVSGTSSNNIARQSFLRFHCCFLSGRPVLQFSFLCTLLSLQVSSPQDLTRELITGGQEATELHTVLCTCVFLKCVNRHKADHRQTEKLLTERQAMGHLGSDPVD